MAKRNSKVKIMDINTGLLGVCLSLFVLICLLTYYCVENYESFKNSLAMFKLPSLGKNSINLQKLTTPVYPKLVKPIEPPTNQQKTNSTKIPKLKQKTFN